MILFTQENAQKILRDMKDMTRRLGEKRWNIGAFHQLKTGFRKNDVFAGAIIVSAEQEALGQISDSDIQREGYKTRSEFLRDFLRINRQGYNLDSPVWIVIFEKKGMMQISRHGQIVGLLEYNDPLLADFAASRDHQLKPVLVDRTRMQPHLECSLKAIRG